MSAHRFRRLSVLPLLALAVLAAAPAHAATTQRLAPSDCDAGRVFAGRFERGAAPTSGGSGGAWPGDAARSVSVAGLGARTYYLYVPASYRPGIAAPLLVVLHGAAGSPALAVSAAQATRSHWSTAAEAGGFLVLAPVASGSQGGWSPGVDGAWLDAALQDVRAAYAIDTSRESLWGYSAGAHWGYALALDAPHRFAGFAAHAGALEAYACDALGAPTCATLLGGVERRPPIVIRVGTSDPMRAYAQADRMRLIEHGWDAPGLLDYAEFHGGHTYTAAHLDQAWAHLCRYAVDP